MCNPWLQIPLADYEAHMTLPEVDQSQMLADQLQAAVTRFAPRSVALIGCAGGNGFDRLTGPRINSVVGVDINPEYIEAARRRYQGRVGTLDLHVADIQTASSVFAPVDLLYVALVLEYVDVVQALAFLSRHCVANGILAVVSQLPHATLTAVSPGPYASLQRLVPVMHLLPSPELQLRAEQAGFSLEQSATVRSTAGKHFAVDTFRRRA